jgi:DNA polymerase I-like protein with 3'-5' exonuclease and polymerase domains
MDARQGWLVYQAQEPDLAREYGGDTRPLELERDQLGPLFRLRLNGAPVDVPRLHQMERELSARLITEEAGVYRAAGAEFNLNSTPQKQRMLYLPTRDGGQGLRPWKLTDTGRKHKDAGDPEDVTWWSTDDDVLASYPANPLATALRKYGDTHKLLGTYVQGWLGVDGDKDKPARVFSGRIHTAFNQAATFTGRYSSSSPNLQNIPRPDTDDGKLIRGAVLAPDGHSLVVADYSQIELAVLAHFLGQGKLFDGFWEGIDPHTVTAAGVLGKDPADVTKPERQKYGKTMNFAIDYGASVKKIADMMGTSQKQAREFMARHEEEFPEIYAYQEHVWAEAATRTPPYITTLLGRKRRIAALNSPDPARQASARRRIFNAKIQGSAADLMKLSIPRADAMLTERVPDAWLALTVHDELVAVSPTDQAIKVRDILVEAMTGPDVQRLIKVPLSVDAVVCQRWSESK